MVTVRHAGRPRGTSAARVVRRRWHGLVRRMRTSALTPALLLCVTSVLLGVGMHIVPMVFPLVTLVIPMVVGSLVLGPRLLPWVVLFNLGVLVSVVLSTRDLLNPTRIGGVVVIFVIGLVILLFSFRRSALGIAGMRGESMLVDLRDRIHHQAAMPALPDGWYAEAVMRSAGASPFAGDFIVGSLARDGRSLQVAVVDVSGKGEQAGSRSLLLSGAFGGLL